MTASGWRLPAALLGLTHAAGAIAWWALMAGGFPLLHPHALANRGIPALVLALATALLLAAVGERERGCRVGVAALSGWWIGVGVAAPWIFPVSLSRASVLLLVVLAVALAIAALRQRSWALRGAVMLPSAALGAAAVLVQRAPEPSTRPLGDADRMLALSPSTCDHDGTIEAHLGPVTVRLAPLLTFESISPDRGWTALAPGDTWRGRAPRCVGLRHSEDVLQAMFEGEGRSQLEVRHHEDNLEIEALTAIDAPVFSHLNTYTAIALEGPGPLSITLSPCPDLRLRFPHGEREPLRFAYLDRAGEFVIVDADQAEKGPFVERCRGPLARGAPLILEVHAGDARVGEVRLHDWADQASLDLSPTAGWRIPQNAIELWGGDDPGFGLIHVSLAATSVGRGWHSVGHRAGVYRNRVEVRAGPTRPDQ